MAAVPGAWWRIRPLSAFDWRDILAGFNRLVRQAHGRLENQAWNAIIWQCGFSALPKFADEMIKSWLRTARPKRERFLDRFFTYIAIRKIRKSKLPSEQDLRPLKVDF